MSVDTTELVTFDKSIIISNNRIDNNGEPQDNTGSIGQLRFNHTTNKFEGYHGSEGADVFGNIWRSLTQDVATVTSLGIFSVGNNLTITPKGVLSSIAFFVKISIKFNSWRFCIAFSKLPTPGKIILLAAWISLGSEVIVD